jgi:hypothetical protein
MKIINVNGDTTTIEIGWREAVLLINSVSLTKANIYEQEFHSRTGGTVEEAKKLIEELRPLVEQMLLLNGQLTPEQIQHRHKLRAEYEEIKKGNKKW